MLLYALLPRGLRNTLSSPGSGSGESELLLPAESKFSVLFANIRGFVSHKVELQAHLHELHTPPLVLLCETFLNPSIQAPSLNGYQCVARRDRPDRSGGGVIAFVRNDVMPIISLLSLSSTIECIWLLLHVCWPGDHWPPVPAARCWPRLSKDAGIGVHAAP